MEAVLPGQTVGDIQLDSSITPENARPTAQTVTTGLDLWDAAIGANGGQQPPDLLTSSDLDGILRSGAEEADLVLAPRLQEHAPQTLPAPGISDEILASLFGSDPHASEIITSTSTSDHRPFYAQSPLASRSALRLGTGHTPALNHPSLRFSVPNSLASGSGTANYPGLAFLSSLPELPTLPYSLPAMTPEDLSPLLTLSLESLVIPQLETFFARVYPMIPIFPRSYIFDRLHQSHLAATAAQPAVQHSAHSYTQDRSFLSLIFAMCALSIIHPLEPHELASRPHRIKQAKVLMDESLRLRARWEITSHPTCEGILTSYLLFGALFEMGYGDGARMKLREAISGGEALRLGDLRSYQWLEVEERTRRVRMFWVLAITER